MSVFEAFRRDEVADFIAASCSSARDLQDAAIKSASSSRRTASKKQNENWPEKSKFRDGILKLFGVMNLPFLLRHLVELIEIYKMRPEHPCLQTNFPSKTGSTFASFAHHEYLLTIEFTQPPSQDLTRVRPEFPLMLTWRQHRGKPWSHSSEDWVHSSQRKFPPKRRQLPGTRTSHTQPQDVRH